MKVLILHASAGEGHRRAALAVESGLLRSGMSQDQVQVRDALDYGSPFFKKSYTEFYYACVKYIPWIWGVFYALLDHPGVYAFFYPIRRVYNAWHGRRLLATVLKEKPDWIICTHFFSAEVLGHAKQKSDVTARLSVLVTDFHPVRVWQHPGIDDYFVLSEEAKKTLIKRDVAAEKISVSGFPILSDFQKIGDRRAVLKKYEMDPERITLLLTTGSFGLGEQKRLLDLLVVAKNHIQCLVVCGRNEALFNTLQSEKYLFPVRIFGFVNFMPELMDAADVMVAKPGGATTAEAMAKGVPMIATGAIPGQETENLKFLLSQNAVFSAESVEAIVSQIEQIVKNRRLLDEKRRACERISNPRAADDIAQTRFISKMVQ